MSGIDHHASDRTRVSGTHRFRTSIGVGAVMLATLVPWGGLAGQTSAPGSAASILASLQGSWHGTGTLFDQPAAFSMEWEVDDGPFARLSFRNALIAADGSETTVLTSEATYLLQGPSVVGVWVDTRPQRLTLEGEATDSSLVIRWTAPTEEGRTEYIVRSGDEVAVRDFVLREGEYSLFAESMYRRR